MPLDKEIKPNLNSFRFNKLTLKILNRKGWSFSLFFFYFSCNEMTLLFWLSSFTCYLISLTDLWQKVKSMEHPVRIKLINNGLLTYFDNHYTKTVSLLRWPPPLKKKSCLGYDTKLHLMIKLPIWRVWSTPLLLPGPLWPTMVVPIRISSMGQIDLFKIYS